MTAVKTKDDILDILASHRKEIASFGVKRLGIFGSFVGGRQNERSDVDVLIEFLPEKKNFKNFIHLVFFLEDLLRRKVEVVTPEGLSSYLKPSILKEVEYVIE